MRESRAGDGRRTLDDGLVVLAEADGRGEEGAGDGRLDAREGTGCDGAESGAEHG